MNHVKRMIVGAVGLVAVGFMVAIFIRGATTRWRLRQADATSRMAGQEARAKLAADINSLPEREKFAVTLYFFEGLTLAEVGDILGVTESRAGEILTKAVDGGLRRQLSEFD